MSLCTLPMKCSVLPLTYDVGSDSIQNLEQEIQEAVLDSLERIQRIPTAEESDFFIFVATEKQTDGSMKIYTSNIILRTPLDLPNRCQTFKCIVKHALNHLKGNELVLAYHVTPNVEDFSLFDDVYQDYIDYFDMRTYDAFERTYAILLKPHIYLMDCIVRQVVSQDATLTPSSLYKIASKEGEQFYFPLLQEKKEEDETIVVVVG